MPAGGVGGADGAVTVRLGAVFVEPVDEFGAQRLEGQIPDTGGCGMAVQACGDDRGNDHSAGEPVPVGDEDIAQLCGDRKGLGGAPCCDDYSFVGGAPP